LVLHEPQAEFESTVGDHTHARVHWGNHPPMFDSLSQAADEPEFLRRQGAQQYF
jgi:hypothetical protein